MSEELPAEITAAIDAYGSAIEQFGAMTFCTFEDGAMVEQARTVLDAVILAHLACGADRVPMPQNADQAVGMWLVGENWVRTNAPERLRPASSDLGRSALSETTGEGK